MTAPSNAYFAIMDMRPSSSRTAGPWLQRWLTSLRLQLLFRGLRLVPLRLERRRPPPLPPLCTAFHAYALFFTLARTGAARQRRFAGPIGARPAVAARRRAARFVAGHWPRAPPGRGRETAGPQPVLHLEQRSAGLDDGQRLRCCDRRVRTFTDRPTLIRMRSGLETSE